LHHITQTSVVIAFYHLATRLSVAQRQLTT